MWALVNRLLRGLGVSRPSKDGKQHPDLSNFDPEWYLAAYPDVAQQGMDPWTHYRQHGRFENRLPRQNRALEWEHALWRGASMVMLAKLHWLVAEAEATEEERVAGRLALARWFRWQEDWLSVRVELAPNKMLVSGKPLNTPNLALLMVEACCFSLTEEPDSQYLNQLLSDALRYLDREYSDTVDAALAHANAASVKTSFLFRAPNPFARINRIYAQKGLATLTRQSDEQPFTLDNLSATGAAIQAVQEGTSSAQKSVPLVSVIVPVYNAETTVGTALMSLFAQQGVRLEILAVDDASTDNSVAVVQQYSERCPAHVSLRLVQHATNQGAYAARNTGAAEASGEFVTVHDSDDWSHPEKLYHQVEALRANSALKATLSYWARTTPGLLFHRWRLDEHGWVYPNISSLMMRHAIIETLGFWDEVKVNSDTEFRERIVAAYGPESVSEVLPNIPLSFGRSRAESLSQHTASHLSSQFSGMRYHYMAAARHWHAQASTPEALYLPRAAAVRPFYAPREMLRDQAPVINTVEDRLRASALFDPGWYLQRYADLQSAMIEPFAHFCSTGSKEGRDPGPGFSTSGYRRVNQVALAEQRLEPWEHYLLQLTSENAPTSDALPIWPGERVFPGRPCVLLCAHQVGETLFGAERSLLDVLSAMGALRWNVVVLLPEAGNADYEARLLEQSQAVAVVPYGWWVNRREPVTATVEHISRVIDRFSIQAVHANTLVLDEPLHAARLASMPVIVHVRELPAHDPALCETLGATPEEIVTRTHRCADVIIVNSQAAADAFTVSPETDDAAPIHIVPNTIDMAPLQALAARLPSGEFKVGMLSSNLPKKGLDDIEQVAAALKPLAPSVQLYLFGPNNDAIERLLARQVGEKPPINLHYAGYVEHVEQALAEVDAVVNLSHFQESFGRTVLEAMAAARPVVAYEWGALPELIKEGETGYLVPFASPSLVAERLAQLSESPALCQQMGLAGRQRAITEFGAEGLKAALEQSYVVNAVFKSPL
ncbi:glycosyltransferase [Halomonas sp.]|uniref:glycosyltransferase n=1 Tax=Halomonas sp. TaxID=1486246 RepID=UPI003F9288B6